VRSLARIPAITLRALATLACLTVCMMQQADAQIATSNLRGSYAGLRVLFIGNSYTYYNDLPEMFAGLAQAGGWKEVTVRMIAPGGWRLKDHWIKGDARAALSSEHWDYVVLQEQSTLGVNYYLEGRIRIAGDEIFRPYAKLWSREIYRLGATPVFYLTWAPRDTPEDQARLTFAYGRAARENHALLAPAGMAWSRVRDGDPAIGLFYRQGSHPSPAGTYLAACSLYSTIFQRSPVGLPRRVMGHPVDLKTEKIEPDQTVALADVPEADAATLQSAAWAAQQELRAQSTSFNRLAPTVPNVKPLPAGISLNGIEGKWAGTISFYPVGPVDMQLDLRRGPVPSALLGLKYPSESFPTESIEVDNLRLHGKKIVFSDPKSAGVDGLPVRFEGVRNDKNEITGIAETARRNPDSPLSVLGTWQLRRISER
jgi:hypothetical protein